MQGMGMQGMGMGNFAGNQQFQGRPPVSRRSDCADIRPDRVEHLPMRPVVQLQCEAVLRHPTAQAAAVPRPVQDLHAIRHKATLAPSPTSYVLPCITSVSLPSSKLCYALENLVVLVFQCSCKVGILQLRGLAPFLQLIPFNIQGAYCVGEVAQIGC